MSPWLWMCKWDPLCPWQGKEHPGPLQALLEASRLILSMDKKDESRKEQVRLAKVEKLCSKHFMGNCKTSEQFNRLTSPFSGISKTELSSSLLTDGQAPESSIRDHFLIKESILPRCRGDKVLQIPSPNILPTPKLSVRLCQWKCICLPLSAAGDAKGEREICIWCAGGRDRPPSRTRLWAHPAAPHRQKGGKWEGFERKMGEDGGKKSVSVIPVPGHPVWLEPESLKSHPSLSDPHSFGLGVCLPDPLNICFISFCMYQKAQKELGKFMKVSEILLISNLILS